MPVIDLRGQRIDVHVRKQSRCAFNVDTGIDLTGALLHASITDVDGAVWFTLSAVAVGDPTKGKLEISVPDPLSLYNTISPGGALAESTHLEWSVARHVVEGGGFYHEPLAYGTFAISGPAGISSADI